MTPTRQLSEDDLIARFFAPLAGEGGLGLRDDAALLRPSPGHDLVVTVDGLVAGVHFFGDDPPASIARKALAVNVSDLAAKAALPTGFVLTLALPPDWNADWLGAFAQGLGEAARTFRCPLLGGDTVRTPGPFSVSVTALGEVPAGGMRHRFSAEAGDLVCVTGTIGDAVLGLALRRADGAGWATGLGLADRVTLTDRFLHPQPRLAAVPALRAVARATMDVSDGLAGDLAKMARAAGLSAEVDLDAVPLSAAARAALRQDSELLEHLVTGGDDYEILCAVPPERFAEGQAMMREAGLDFTAIGRFTPGGDLPVFRSGDHEHRFARGSYSHF